MTPLSEQSNSAATWDALEGVKLRRVPIPGDLCLVCGRWSRRGRLATCSPKCNRLWRAFLDNMVAPARPGYRWARVESRS